MYWSYRSKLKVYSYFKAADYFFHRLEMIVMHDDDEKNGLWAFAYFIVLRDLPF